MQGECPLIQQIALAVAAKQQQRNRQTHELGNGGSPPDTRTAKDRGHQEERSGDGHKAAGQGDDQGRGRALDRSHGGPGE